MTLGERLLYLEGFAIGANLRIEALEKRVHKLEDVVNEILRSSAGIGRLVQASDRATDRQSVSPDRDAARGAE